MQDETLTALSGLEEYRERHGDWPQTLADAGLDDPWLRYETNRAGYTLEATNGSEGASFSNSGRNLRLPSFK